MDDLENGFNDASLHALVVYLLLSDVVVVASLLVEVLREEALCVRVEITFIKYVPFYLYFL